MAVTLHDLVRVLGGRLSGSQWLGPGPGHSRDDESLSIRLSTVHQDGFTVHSFAGDDWRTCRDYVATALGWSRDRWRDRRESDPAEIAQRRAIRRKADDRQKAETARKQRFAIAMWEAGRDPRGSAVEVYLRSRGLDLPDEIAGSVLRYHPHCPWEGGAVPAMVASLRDVQTGLVVGVHRTQLSPDGRKVGRKMFGTASNAAVMLDPEEEVGIGLTVGEGIETCLAARQLGLRPVWALCSTSNIAALPVLPGVETLSLLGENDANGASAAAIEAAALRWNDAERAVDIVTPKVGKDMNDALLGRVAA